MISVELYNRRGRRWVYFGGDKRRASTLIDTNEYLVENGGKGLLADPGGTEIFPAVVAAVSRKIRIADIEAIFASHQDPDIVSSLSLWMGLIDGLDVYASWVWKLFIPHFAGGAAIRAIPDEGMTIPLGGSSDLVAVPAHYLHSSGNFNLYDPQAKILFSGDIGAALMPEGEVFVKDFGGHTQYMEGFHKRWMPSNTAKNDWVRRVRDLDVEIMAPQHGAIFRGDDVKRFLDWFEALEVGSAVRMEKGES
ncbi:MAG: MBL fold metallo-hydrolase [Candidatus Nitrospinota bacterium M3_3B_026]